ncbi:MAG: hypothetical protein GY841_10345 [FCB group bacterium]|nr:hypothetical protein [FCB group bacterium]
MRIALVDASPLKSITLYPLPLLKLGAWRKSLGDECVIFSGKLPTLGAFDEIWLTTRFTYDIPFAVGMAKAARERAGRVWVGGISATLLPEYFEREGLEVHRGLLPDAEKFSPDYSLLSERPAYSISHTSRGCIRKCGFCMVSKLEPTFKNRDGWENDLHPSTHKVLFYDNNWLAKELEDFRADVDKLRGLVADGRITKIDFNQGLDARLVTDEIANLLQGLPIKPVRFAFDGMHEDGHYQRAVEMMAARGFREFMTYVLYNFKDTPKDFYYRLRESVRLTQELPVNYVGSFPMRYQPILEADRGRSFVGKHWTTTAKKGFMNILQIQSLSGQVTCAGGHFDSKLQEFEYWFGKTADEFDRLLSYPHIRDLMKRKKGALRMRRARGFGITPTRLG